MTGPFTLMQNDFASPLNLRTPSFMVKSLSEFGMVPLSPGPGATQGGGQEGLIEDHAAAGDVAGRRLHLPQAGSKPSRRDQSRRRRGLGATPDR